MTNTCLNQMKACLSMSPETVFVFEFSHICTRLSWHPQEAHHRFRIQHDLVGPLLAGAAIRLETRRVLKAEKLRDLLDPATVDHKGFELVHKLGLFRAVPNWMRILIKALLIERGERGREKERVRF